jgi:hypothetical protein
VTGRVVRTDWRDWYVEDGRSAVLVDGRVVVLSELATSLLEATSVGPRGSRVDDLASHLVAVFGEPVDDDPVAATVQVVQSLADEGVVRALPDDLS